MQRPPWKKLLYLRQPYADNYTDASFLDQLKRNSSVAKYSHRKLFADFSVFSLYGSLLLLVNINFSAIYHRLWAPHIPTLATSTITLVLLLVHVAQGGSHKFKAYAMMLLLLLLVSPVLRSLTESTSLDSIWALLCVMTCLNVACHHYGLDPARPYRSVVSTNLSFANGIVLASRLLSSTSVFSFLLFSVEVAVLAPILDFRLRRYLLAPHYALGAIVGTVCFCLLYVVHGGLFAALYLLSIAFVLIFLPLYFLFLQRYKNELQGPWDVAKPVVRSIP